METQEHLDILIIGAGLSGIDAAYRVQTACPGKTYAILEARNAIGGTWDLFRYPGVRSDSDMHTLGFPFRPFHAEELTAGGAAVREYRRMIRLSCSFLYMCSGYYDYDGGFSPKFPGVERFKGQILHPQDWPGVLDYAGKKIIVIGSGATAVTLVPALAADAAHVTMLQRSPSYIVSRPAKDAHAIWLYRHLPERIAARLIRWKNVVYGILLFHLARTRPEKIKGMILDRIRQELGADSDVERHFTPRYNPWHQRVCLAPDGDLFAAIRSGQVSIVTDTIETFVESGIRLHSGATLPADIIVSATGLVMRFMGGVAMSVDGVPVKFDEKMLYKGVMFSDVPNLAMAFGYANASWTLRCDLTARYVCRLLNYMDRKKWSICVPRPLDLSVVRKPLIDFSSGYIRRADAVLPKQGQKAPWRVEQNYASDLMSFALGSVRDGTMKFHARSRNLPTLEVPTP